MFTFSPLLLVSLRTTSQFRNENHEFLKRTNDDLDVRVKSSTLVPTDVHTHDNDTSDVECESVVESTVTNSDYF